MRLPGNQRHLIPGTLFILLCLAFVVPVVNGQDPQSPDQTAPPPLKIIPRDERTQLEEAKDDKARVKLTIELADTHLANAESHTSQQRFDGAAAEAGMYRALIENALNFLKKIERDTNLKRDLYKRLELALRAHGPRWRTIQRSTPAEYAVWIKDTEEFTRAGRTEALNSFYGHTVVRERPQKPSEGKGLDKPPEKNQ